jgi:hypothetical protein
MSIILKQATGIALVIVTAMTAQTSFALVLTLLVAYSLLGPAQAIKAMALSVALKYLNPALTTYDTTSSLLFWLLLVTSGLRVLLTLRAIDAKLLLVWAFSSIAMVLSLISSHALIISVTKVITFAWVVTTVLVAFSALTGSELAIIKRWFIAFALVVLISSAFTLLRPAVAYQFLPGSLQGILNHPQSLGTFAAPAAAWTLSGLVLMRPTARAINIAVTVLVWAVMLLSLSRTAAIAAVGATAIAGLRRLLAGQRVENQASILRLTGSIAVGIALVIAVSALTGQLDVAVRSFVLKRSAPSVSESFIGSRGGGIESEWHNFLARPFLGNGFGVYANGEFPSGIVEVAGIPISAPVEKGFVPTAVLEETGIIGGCLFLWLLVSLANDVGKDSDLRWVAAFWAALLVNLGEAVIFSPGGIGLLIWLLIGLCVTSGRRGKSTFQAANEAHSAARYATKPQNLLR